jgi:transposase-like protein
LTESLDEEKLEHANHPMIIALLQYKSNFNSESLTVEDHLVNLSRFREELVMYETPFWATDDMVANDIKLKLEMLEKIDKRIKKFKTHLNQLIEK